MAGLARHVLAWSPSTSVRLAFGQKLSIAAAFPVRYLPCGSVADATRSSDPALRATLTTDCVALGFLKVQRDWIEKDPVPFGRVQEAIGLVFTTFTELQTVRQLAPVPEAASSAASTNFWDFLPPLLLSGSQMPA